MNFFKFSLRSSFVLCGVQATSYSLAGKASCDKNHKSKSQIVCKEQFRPDLQLYERIDHQLTDDHSMKVDHALHETLAGDRMIEVYEIYRKLNDEEIYCIVKFGKSINGYPGVVHGGEINSTVSNLLYSLYML